jgi:hypothetical protein
MRTEWLIFSSSNCNYSREGYFLIFNLYLVTEIVSFAYKYFIRLEDLTMTVLEKLVD